MNAMAEVRFLPQSQYQQLETRFDIPHGALWGFMNPKPRATFNPQLLLELQDFVQSIIHGEGMIWNKGQQHSIHYAVIASKFPKVFNLGGDLALFRNAIVRGDRGRLVAYGNQCINNLYPWSRNCDLPLTTIALVQGDALGGGFECALSSTVLIAEESSRMGFPEINFNLFPGMGAFSYLSRKVGRRMAKELVSDGNLYSARQLYEMGVVDVVASDGEGEAAVYAYIKKHSRSAQGHRAIENVSRVVDPVTKEELIEIVGIWADTALCLEDRDLRMMERLIRAQDRGVEATLISPELASTVLRRHIS